MRRVLKMNPSVAKIADKIVATIVATEGQERCLQLCAPSVELILRFLSNRLMEDPSSVWNVSRGKNKQHYNMDIFTGLFKPGFIFFQV